jgi:hypothetical protein
MTTSAQATKTNISKDGQTATVSIPVTFLQRGGRKQILPPPGASPWSPAPRVDTALVKAVVRAHRWRQMLESGEYNSSAELASCVFGNSGMSTGSAAVGDRLDAQIRCYGMSYRYKFSPSIQGPRFGNAKH